MHTVWLLWPVYELTCPIPKTPHHQITHTTQLNRCHCVYSKPSKNMTIRHIRPLEGIPDDVQIFTKIHRTHNFSPLISRNTYYQIERHACLHLCMNVQIWLGWLTLCASIGGSVVECSPATRAARVRFPADAKFSFLIPIWFMCFTLNSCTH